MRSLLKNSFLSIIIVSISVGCRKDAPPEVDPTIFDTICYEGYCAEIPPPKSMIGWQTVITGPQYRWPCFNPNNTDEFIYIKDNGAGSTELIKHTISSEDETVLCDSLNIISQPKWGKLGWISFATINKKVWKISEDGVQIEQLTNGVKDLAPNFNPSGTQIYYDRGIQYTNFELEQNPDLYKEHKIIIIDLDGNAVDSIMANDPIPNNYFVKWQIATITDSKIFFAGGTDNYYGVYELNTTDDNIESINLWSLLSEANLILSMDFSSNEVYYSKFRKGIFKTNVLTGEVLKIRMGCDMRYYDGISVSDDGKSMLVERVVTSVLNDYELDEQREILLIDLVDGCKMEIILGE